jgi:phage terminase large subunit-like protein
MQKTTPQLPEDPETRARLIQILEDRKEALAWRCNREQCDGLPHEGREYRHARSKQRPPWGAGLPETDKNIRRWYLRGGRGSGKTHAGSYALKEIILWNGGIDENGDRREYGIVGPSFKYTKETLMEGGSGLIKAFGGENGKYIKDYNRTTGTLTLTNGAVVFTAGADNNGQGIEGKNLSAIWLDEVGLWSLRRWKYTWEQAIRFAVRKDPAYFIMTGTPKEGHPFVKELVNDANVKTVVMSTKENTALPENVRAEYEAMYAGTRLGRQELEGEVLFDIPGAMWTIAQIETNRLQKEDINKDEIKRIFIGWDPATTNTEGSDEHGIMVAGQLSTDPIQYVVLEDGSGKYSPMEAVRKIIDLYDTWNADMVVAETNNGGDMIESLLRTATTTIPFTKVTATRGKRLRAEPIAALSEQGRLKMAGVFPKLEEQMTTWSVEQAGSPDRLDAMVWAVTALTQKASSGNAYWGKHRISVRSN